MAINEEGKQGQNVVVNKVCRDRSPRLLVTKKKRVMARNGFRYRKINRMEIQHSAHCRIVEVDSPNQLFAKFDTDVTSNLQYKCPYLLTRYYVPKDSGNGESLVTDYVMAPLEEDTYSRARILKVVPDEAQPGTFYCLVVFIDHGSCQWVHTDALAMVDEKLFYQPWQAFAFSLFGLAPSRRYTELTNVKKPKQVWTQEHKRVLRTIIEKYDKFIIQSVVSLKDLVKEECLPYYLFGLDGDRKVDIALQFTLECRQEGLEVEIDRSSRLFTDHQEFRPKYFIEPKLDMNGIQTWRRTISSIWGEVIPAHPPGTETDNSQFTKHAYISTVTKKFDSEFEPSAERPSPMVRTFNNAILQREYVQNDGTTAFILISTERMSVGEFYVMPLKRRIRAKHIDNSADAVEEASRNLRAFSSSLDAFYVESCHRYLVNPKITCEGIIVGKEQYAIYELPQNADAGDGRYRRVMLIGLRLISDDHFDANSWMVHVVYLDFGGCDWVPLGSLLRIHSMHCLQEPFVVQIFAVLNDLVEQHRGQSRYDDCLSTILRAVVPVHSVLIGKLHTLANKSGKIVASVPHHRPNVLALDHFKVEGSQLILEDVICQIFKNVLSTGYLQKDRPVEVKVVKKGSVIRLKNQIQEPEFSVAFEFPEEEEEEKVGQNIGAARFFAHKAAEANEEFSNLSLE
ncbi:hypothetical protein QR680_008793 [Steinernema hermaphroditum]|uniref:Tudor domain-containing protein n=1 Tax=Steinernema hermaphroditum TaxID=289476 RepID=A0AA39IJF8_9BILA|nr:hypothetical protein QR680_008793 [Steinernema hermaphroditum]